MNLIGYLFSAPDNGPYLSTFAVLVVVNAVVGLIASGRARRAGLASVKRRAQRLRSICFWMVLPGAIYLLARYQQIEVLELRIWLYLILGIFMVRLAAWALTLRSLSADKVDERTRRRKQLYRRGRSRRPVKRRKR